MAVLYCNTMQAVTVRFPRRYSPERCTTLALIPLKAWYFAPNQRWSLTPELRYGRQIISRIDLNRQVTSR